MVGEGGLRPEGQDNKTMPFGGIGERIKGDTNKAQENPKNEYCAELHLNGCSISCPLEGCWCHLLLPDPTDEIIFKLGKSVLDCLTNRPLKGQDGAVMVVVELRI